MELELLLHKLLALQIPQNRIAAVTTFKHKDQFFMKMHLDEFQQLELLALVYYHRLSVHPIYQQRNILRFGLINVRLNLHFVMDLQMHQVQ